MVSKNRIQSFSLAMLAMFIASILAACAPVDPLQPFPEPTQTPTETQEQPRPTQPTDMEIAFSDLDRDTSPSVSQDDLAALVEGNSAFAFDFYQAVQARDGNLFYSPFSLSLALAMTYAGARGETEEQMAATMRFTLPQDRLHAAFNALDLQLAEQVEQAPEIEEGRRFQLNVANSVWAQQGYPFLPEFLDMLALNYGSGINLVDFILGAEAARLEINQWVSDQTQGKIEDLIPQGAIDDLTRLVLVNAIYFNAGWLYPFAENLTQDGAFYLLDGSQIEVPMMSHDQPKRMNYFRGDGYQAVELPYEGNLASMILLVPDRDNFTEFESGMDSARLAAIMEGLERTNVALEMPRFEFTSKFRLAEVLEEMGMPDAFDPDLANFSGMDGTRELYITDVIHQAFVAVDEEGTEAAAATAVIVGVTSLPVTEVELNIDRPFIFVIRDNTTGTILFVGRVLNPAG